MKQQNMQWVKAVPFLLLVGIIAAVVFGVVWVTSKPEVIKAKGELATAAATLYNSKQVYYQQLPEILNKSTILALAVAGGIAGLAFVISFSVNMVIFNVDRVVSHGWEFEKNVGGQKTTYKLFHSNPVPYKLGPGQQPRISVEPPGQGMLGRGGSQQLSQGRKLKPEERQAPGRNPLHTQPETMPQSLGSGTQPKLSKEDPLSVLEDTQIF